MNDCNHVFVPVLHIGDDNTVVNTHAPKEVVVYVDRAHAIPY